MNLQEQCITAASLLLRSMRGEGNRIGWISNPSLAALLVRLSFLSGLPTYSFAQCIDLGGATISYFERGLSSSQKPWPELRQFLKQNNLELFQTVISSIEDRGLRDMLTSISTQSTQTHPTDSSPEISSLIERVATLRVAAQGKHVSWSDHPELMEELRQAWEKWSVTRSLSAFCITIGIHRDVMTRYFGLNAVVPPKKAKSKKAKSKKASSKKASSKKAATPTPTPAPTPAPAPTPVPAPVPEVASTLPMDLGNLAPTSIKLRVADNGEMLIQYEVRLLPGDPGYVQLIKHLAASFQG